MALTKVVTNAITDDAVTAAKIADGTIVAADLAANSVDSSELVNGSVDLAHMSVNSIDSDQYVDGSIDNAHIADDAIDSEHYADGSIDNAHIADDAIDSEHYADGSIDNAHIADDAIDSEHYADGSIDNAHIADDQIDSEHYADGSIDLAHMSSQSIDEDNLYISNSGSNGQFLSKQSGNNGGLTWATASANTPSSADGQALGSASLEWSDLYLADSGVIYMGNDQDITITHNPDAGLIIKNKTEGADGCRITLQSAETTVVAGDRLGDIDFRAIDEASGTDAILVAARIRATSEGTFAADNNATKLEFFTAASEAATVKVVIESGGHLRPAANDSYDLGTSSYIWRDIYTGDLNLTNVQKDEGNDIDGTKGSWKIQEGENDLFIMNKVSGKKYKFKLEEIV